MLVSLYTSRVVLETLGADDFGIYNVVGGVVVLFSFIQGAMATATQRYLNYELGKGDSDAVSRVFSMSMTVHIAIAILIVLLSETIGLWFLNTQMQIPPKRYEATQWVYQFSIITCCINILRVPYNASIIAYEKMSFYAYISILEVLMKLAVVYLLLLTDGDKLVVYSLLMFIVPVVVSVVYRQFCRTKFSTCNYHLFWDKSLFKEIFGFSAWSLFGSLANLGATQGINILLNIFCGVAVNAAMGLAQQVNSAVNQFITNFQTAFVPQIVKLYAKEEREEFIKLIFRSSKMSYYLILMIGMPVLLYARPLLSLWLHEVPEYTVQFTQLMIVFSMIDAVSGPLWNSVQATGKIRNYQILMASIISLNVPFAYIVLKLGFSPIIVLVIRVSLNLILHFVRIFYLKGVFDFPSWQYIKEVMFRVVVVTIFSLPVPVFIFRMRPSPSVAALFAYVVLIVAQTFVVIAILGLNVDERRVVKMGLEKKFLGK